MYPLICGLKYLQQIKCSGQHNFACICLKLLEIGLNLQGADIVSYVSLYFWNCNEKLVNFSNQNSVSNKDFLHFVKETK